MDHGTRLSSILADAFIHRCALANASDWKDNDKLIQLGFALGKLSAHLIFSYPRLLQLVRFVVPHFSALFFTKFN